MNDIEAYLRILAPLKAKMPSAKLQRVSWTAHMLSNI